MQNFTKLKIGTLLSRICTFRVQPRRLRPLPARPKGGLRNLPKIGQPETRISRLRQVIDELGCPPTPPGDSPEAELSLHRSRSGASDGVSRREATRAAKLAYGKRRLRQFWAGFVQGSKKYR